MNADRRDRTPGSNPRCRRKTQCAPDCASEEKTHRRFRREPKILRARRQAPAANIRRWRGVRSEVPAKDRRRSRYANCRCRIAPARQAASRSIEWKRRRYRLACFEAATESSRAPVEYRRGASGRHRDRFPRQETRHTRLAPLVFSSLMEVLDIGCKRLDGTILRRDDDQRPPQRLPQTRNEECARASGQSGHDDVRIRRASVSAAMRRKSATSEMRARIL